MTKFEDLELEALNNNIDVVTDYSFDSKNIRGLYCDGTVALSKRLKTNTEKACILSEELGHYYTTTGNILNQSLTENRKLEQRARIWAYNKLIGLSGIIDSYKAGCDCLNSMAEYFEVTEEFLIEALEYYRTKYGVCKQLGNYVIYFEPSIGILELL